jgi:hypothetical protein
MRLGLLMITLFSALGLAVVGVQAAPWTSAGGLSPAADDLLSQIGGYEICKPVDATQTVSVCSPIDPDDVEDGDADGDGGDDE